jgi:hypothetical protein
MTNERQTPDTGVEDDVLVSDTYREIAHERTPEHLNRSVLDAARKAARPRYSMLRTWTRPTAWAATILLSVALLLEFSQTPMQQAGDVPADLEKREGPTRDAQELTVKDDDMLQRAEEMARMQQGQDDQPAKSVPDVQQPVAAPAAAYAVSSKATLLESAIEPVDDTNPCDAAATAEPETWLACISKLEAAGMTDIAEEQRALLAEAFPDFDSR